jgi:hypothetical protein
MIKVEITFYNTEPKAFNGWYGEMTLHNSTTVRELIPKEYNTDSRTRAFGFAKALVKFLKRRDPDRYRTNHKIEII